MRPLQRAGNRRYYRPADVDLARRIHRLLNQEGYTVRGVQKLLNSGDSGTEVSEVLEAAPAATSPASESTDLERLRAIRAQLADALES